MMLSVPPKAGDSTTVSCTVRVDSGVTSVKWFDAATVAVSLDSGDVKVRHNASVVPELWVALFYEVVALVAAATVKLRR